jgi:hypothetical protein
MNASPEGNAAIRAAWYQDKRDAEKNLTDFRGLLP